MRRMGIEGPNCPAPNNRSTIGPASVRSTTTSGIVATSNRSNVFWLAA